MAALQCHSLHSHYSQLDAGLPVFSKQNSKSSCYSYTQFSSKVARSVRVASNAPPAPVENVPPTIGLEFLGPKPGPDDAMEVQKASALSGEKLLRNIMLDNKIELYGAYGKVMNCGGGGSCGTCLVEIVQGKELLNERTTTEQRYLKKKPETWRLACQTIVGDKENSGTVVVQRQPQWKKK